VNEEVVDKNEEESVVTPKGEGGDRRDTKMIIYTAGRVIVDEIVAAAKCSGARVVRE